MIKTSTLLQFMREEINPKIEIGVAAPSVWERIYKRQSSDKIVEEMTGLVDFGFVPQKTEGNPRAIDTVAPDYNYLVPKIHYGMKYGITLEMRIYNQHERILRRIKESFPESFRQTLEVVGASPFNLAFNPSVTYGDGQPLVSANHPGGLMGTVSNLPAQVIGFSELALEQIATQAQLMKDKRGKLRPRRIKFLMVHPSKMPEAMRILKSAGQNDSANNAINALKMMGSIPEVLSNPYLTDPNAFFVILDTPNGFEMHEGRAFSTRSWEDEDGEVVWTGGYMSNAFACYDTAGAVIGSPGM